MAIGREITNVLLSLGNVMFYSPLAVFCIRHAYIAFMVGIDSVGGGVNG